MMLGFALTGGDGLRLYRELDRKGLQTKKHLRSAAGRSLIVQSLFVTVGLYRADWPGPGQSASFSRCWQRSRRTGLWLHRSTMD